MRVPLVLGAAIACAALLLWSPAARADDAPQPVVTPGAALGNFGLPMSAQEAQERVTFHPFVPSTSYTMVALLPAFHGDDKDHPENRGIGYEYARNGVFYILREWPLAGGSLAHYTAYTGPAGCASGYVVSGSIATPHAVAWQTTALAFALQPDLPAGASTNVKALRAEWERLAKRGVCR